MSVVEIERELQKMSNAERLVVIELATKLVRETMQGKARLPLAEKRRKLKASGEIMLAEYANNPELTALTALDGEEFLDA
jgi:hypothetical protein